ncbi:aryl-sulfate sulfotransferase, partial [candidate division KSB1 bacterium]|nr:aryl-sulfate sulfotransferase [candidate division KSB1 bacterium]
PTSSADIQTYGEVTTINGVTVPSDFPILEIEGDPENTASGMIFTAFRERYIAILQNDGTPYYYLRSGDFLMDFKVQPNGMLSRNVDNNITHEHYFLTMDSNFNVADTFSASPGYVTDHHEFQLLPNGHGLLIARDTQYIDLSDKVDGGRSNVQIIGHNIQELDENNELVWLWRCWDHYDVEDAIHENLTGSSIDFTHINSVAMDYDSNLVISSRNQSECAKINWKTGDFIWRMGGVNNEFDFIDTDMNSYQHMFRPVSNKPNHYTVFDNGNTHDPRYTRAVEFRVDTVQMIVEKVWEYRANPDFRVDWLGSVQRLPNENTLICWGGHSMPFATEVNSTGDLLYQAIAGINIASYRSYRFDWQGISDEPYLITESTGEQITLIFNKFGDTDVDYYKIYSGPSKTGLIFLDTTSLTRYDLFELTSYTHYYFQVTAVNGSGIESLPSMVEHVYIDDLGPQGEIIQNGTFRQGEENWDFLLAGDAEANPEIHAGRYVVHIVQSGNAPGDIQVKQGGIPLYQGQTYLFEFDAHATTPRTIQALLQDNDPPYTNYGQIGYTYILDHRTHHTYTFTMEEDSDYEAEVVFNCGMHDADVYLDNVSLSVTTSVQEEPEIDISPEAFQLSQNFPNPFNGITQIEYDLSNAGDVRIRIFNVRGQVVWTVDHFNQQVGNHIVRINFTNFSTGLYFYQIDFKSSGSQRLYSEIQKMVYIQ